MLSSEARTEFTIVLLICSEINLTAKSALKGQKVIYFVKTQKGKKKKKTIQWISLNTRYLNIYSPEYT